MNYSRFDYLLKSYCRTANYTPAQVAKFLGISTSAIKKYINYPLELPEVELVEKVIKKLSIPPSMVWESYFNSLLELFYAQSHLRLVNYLEYEKMIKANKRKRKSGLIPSDEVFLSLMDKYSLNGLTLADRMNTACDFRLKGKEKLKAVSKNLNISASLTKKLMNKKIVSIKDFSNFIQAQSWLERRFLIENYINSIIEIKKLPFKVLFDDTNEKLLLEQIYSQKG